MLQEYTIRFTDTISCGRKDIPLSNDDARMSIDDFKE